MWIWLQFYIVGRQYALYICMHCLHLYALLGGNMLYTFVCRKHKLHSITFAHTRVFRFILVFLNLTTRMTIQSFFAIWWEKRCLDHRFILIFLYFISTNDHTKVFSLFDEKRDVSTIVSSSSHSFILSPRMYHTKVFSLFDEKKERDDVSLNHLQNWEGSYIVES